MAHFAELDTDNIVLRVIVVSNEVCPDPAPDNEHLGIDFLNGIGLHGIWKQTSYNGSFRKRYAGVGYSFDPERDAFITPKPFPSWSLDENTCDWIAPVSYPSDGARYEWNEDEQQWEELPMITLTTDESETQ